ncbi:MAG: hypothetical protein Q6K80_00790 [Thermostichus sp. DG_1_6_bins_120]
MNFLAEIDTDSALKDLLPLQGVEQKTTTCVLLLLGLGRDLCFLTSSPAC